MLAGTFSFPELQEALEHRLSPSVLEHVMCGLSHCFDEFEPLCFEAIEDMEHWFLLDNVRERAKADLDNL